jgi:hypothetical protein
MMTPDDLDRLIDALAKAKSEGIPIDALLDAFRTMHTEWTKWIERYEELVVYLHKKHGED